MLESEISRQKEEIASLKQQLVESQSIEKERKKLSDKVEKLESKVRPLLLLVVLVLERDLTVSRILRKRWRT